MLFSKKTMNLILLLARYRDELEADFQQFYGLDLGGMGSSFTISHAAVLAAQLPRESRCLIKINPDLEWSNEMSALARIDYEFQILLNAMSGKKGGQKPKPIQTPGERAKLREQLEEIENQMDEMNRILGIGG